ncbi:MAG TPA: hypothetical protein VH092_19875 [Urbifossiella sp.]|jgi:hypothetical protein|nr:hypothetical protein [Urbifossiella sp.]
MDEPQKKMSLELAFEVAMVDAINIYVRTVLAARGHLSPEGFEASGSQDCIQAKYAIVRELATKWAVFDGYERDSSFSIVFRQPSSYLQCMIVSMWPWRSGWDWRASRAGVVAFSALFM